MRQGEDVLSDVEGFMKSLHPSIVYEVLTPDIDGYFITTSEQVLGSLVMLLTNRTGSIQCLKPANPWYDLRILVYP